MTSCGLDALGKGLSGGQHLLDHGRCHRSTDGSMFTSNRWTQGEIPLPLCFDVFFFSHERKGRRKNPPSKPTKGILKLRDTATLSNYCFQLLCVWLFFLSNLRVIFIRAVTGNWVATRVVADNKSQGIKHMPTPALKYTYWFMESDSPYKTIQKSMTKSAQTTFMT